MTKEELEKLNELLKKFSDLTGYHVVDLQVEVYKHIHDKVTSSSFLTTRDGEFMDDKVAYERDMINGEDKLERYSEQDDWRY